MHIPGRIAAFLMSALGLAGVLGCLALVAGVWIGRSRLDTVNTELFSRIDTALAHVDDRLAETQARAEELNLTSQGLRESLGEWARERGVTRLAAQLHVEERSKRLADALEKQDRRLETAAVTLGTLVEIMSATRQTGGGDLADSLERLRTILAEARVRLGTAAEVVEGIRKLDGEDVEKAGDGIAVRLLATFGSVDERLAVVRSRLAESREESTRLESAARRWILLVAVTFTALSAWMAAGQYCLFLRGRNGGVCRTA